MSFIQKNAKGILLCLVLAIPCWFLGQAVPVVGGPVFGILAGMLITLLLKDKTQFQSNLIAAALSAGLTNLSNVSSQEEMMEKMMPVIKEAIEKTPQGEPQQTEATMVLEEGQWKIDDFDLDLGL